jgi:hypothetical protein
MTVEDQRRAFVESWWPSAQMVGQATGFFPELVLATWSIDTGWGVATGMMNCHALLGIVCYDPGRYPCTLCNDTLCFYCYPTWDAFLSTFIEVLNQSQYNVVRAQNTVETQATALALQTGFAGGEGTYLAKILSAIDINRLYIAVPPVCPPGFRYYPPTNTCIEDIPLPVQAAGAVMPVLLGFTMLYGAGLLFTRARRRS